VLVPMSDIESQREMLERRRQKLRG
jgi:hypothetical protein